MSFQDMAFTCYAMHTQAIEDIIEDLVNSIDPNDYNIQQKIFQKHGVNMSSLTMQEIQYIEREVSKKWVS